MLENYADKLIGLLERIKTEQAENIRTAAGFVAESWRQEGLLYLFGTGHSHIIAEEIFSRAGGAAPVSAILFPPLMLHMSAIMSGALERVSGVAEPLLAAKKPKAKDTIIVISNSGSNSVPIEMALGAKKRGMKTIAITSIGHSSQVQSRHKSGKRLYEIADVYVDNGGVRGDACMEIGDTGRFMGATSTVTGAYIVQSIAMEAAAALAEEGLMPDVFVSNNVDGADGENAKIVKKHLKKYLGRVWY